MSWIDSDMLNAMSLNTHNYEENSVMYIIKYCLPDMLWYYALLLSQMLFLSDQKGKGTLILFTVAALVPYVLECLQYFKMIPGTFDIIDILVYTLTLISFILCQRKKLFFK